MQGEEPGKTEDVCRISDLFLDLGRPAALHLGVLFEEDEKDDDLADGGWNRVPALASISVLLQSDWVRIITSTDTCYEVSVC